MSTFSTKTIKELIDEARLVLGGQAVDPNRLVELARNLSNRNEFSYSRKLYNRALILQNSQFTKEQRRQYGQKLALTTYKDTALPADQRFYQALSILDKADDLATTIDRETLGLASSIHKRLWEVEGGRENLEKAYAYSRRGSLVPVIDHDSPYYNHINAAFLLDQLADLEEGALDSQINWGGPMDFGQESSSRPLPLEADKSDRLENDGPDAEKEEGATESRRQHSTLDCVRLRRREATCLREKIRDDLADYETKDRFKRDFWIEVTLAQAYFGLGDYVETEATLRRAVTAYADVSEWQIYSTFEQLVKLAQLIDTRERRESSRKIHAWKEKLKEFLFETDLHQNKRRELNDTIQEEESRRAQRKTDRHKCLKALFTGKNVPNPGAAFQNLYTGKIGVALSGGGFRASLFHIGVLAKLADLGVLNRIEAVSCVSGGSIIGAHYFLELCRLYQVDGKRDQDLSENDYIGIVKNLERDFLKGVQKNIRTRVISNLFGNLRMIFSSKYSRTQRLGELYEKHIYSRVKDRQDHRARWLDEMKIMPIDEPCNFNPRRDNWKRTNKIPIMILNATSLNTGHVWQFTASYMGEPPGSINTEIDAGYRLRRMYYPEAPGPYQNKEKALRRIRLGYAVAASSCVPGMFEPLSLPELYPGKTVQLVDGGVFDNQGIASLLEQDCSVLLVSDASGQMVVEDAPRRGLLNVINRASSISQERIRWAQHRELVARKASGRLKGLMFIHLKKDLGVEPQDWIDCPDPHDSTEDARPPELRGPITRYGVRKDLQQLLSGVRTDLDSFSEGEAYALMASGYLMTEHQFADHKTDLQAAFPDITEEKRLHRNSWYFLHFVDTLKTPGLGEQLKKLLGASSVSAFKIWRLSGWLSRVVDGLLAGTAAFIVGYLLYLIRNPSEVPAELWKVKLGEVSIGDGGWSVVIELGWVLTGFTVYFLSRIVESRVIRLANWQDSLLRLILGSVASTVLFLVSWIHIKIFDKLYLWWGRTHRLIDPPRKREEDC
jgi:predicted acylesterase/phospholipase RssA